MIHNFTLRLLGIRWLDTLDETEDLCAHGSVQVGIGAETVSDASHPEWTVSAAALFLLRTLTRNHSPDEPVGAGQLLPCCGFTMWYFPENGPDTLVLGCPSGIDWTVQHEGDAVRLTTAAGTTAAVPSGEYRAQVLAFADEVERFYHRSKPKSTPTDPLDAAGYARFWEEWQQLREQW
ncbi:hypothetical protein LJ737_23690 [Hymenobacter sp. 15J16-1T3B]|uniref:hypothetical protein n=1 Tax=Hymenobacter sp. 15J16-1T3B TaxID=2886941 RepID=UPI001D115BA2|nr:hypothetical protein [Hymenobacter sp. 15J16-1T3B]MCC3160260.1 hypothetical protein [Hymenobacter sp. 15J16-1T3B]